MFILFIPVSRFPLPLLHKDQITQKMPYQIYPVTQNLTTRIWTSTRSLRPDRFKFGYSRHRIQYQWLPLFSLLQLRNTISRKRPVIMMIIISILRMCAGYFGLRWWSDYRLVINDVIHGRTLVTVGGEVIGRGIGDYGGRASGRACVKDGARFRGDTPLADMQFTLVTVRQGKAQINAVKAERKKVALQLRLQICLFDGVACAVGVTTGSMRAHCWRLVVLPVCSAS